MTDDQFTDIDDLNEIEEAAEGNSDNIEIPNTMPLLPIRDTVVFPNMIIPLVVGREKSIKSVNAALKGNRLIFLSSQKDVSQEMPGEDDIFKSGTVGMIMRMLKLPDGKVKVLIQGIMRGLITDFHEDKPHYEVELEKIAERSIEVVSLETEALMRNTREQLEKLASLGKVAYPEVMMVLENIEDPGRLADLVAANLNLTIEDGQHILEIFDPIKRVQKVYDILSKELQVSQMQVKIQSQAKEEMDRTQREYYLREQLKAIKSELGDIEESNDEFDEFKEKLLAKKMPEDIEKEALKQLERLEMMHPDAAESTIIRNYIEWLIDLPWAEGTADNIDIEKAGLILEEDHYGLNKVKERILEYLAVRKLQSNAKSPILCFVGPPGVGKTSLGRSIARSMGRKFVRISLGGIKDEAEIRGHRRTYVGAMPGRLIQGMKEAGTNNPIFMLDEIDKIGSDYRGDPSSALLEVLDPEQNNTFSDHFLNVPYDLSKVMFIATANMADPIPGPLMDRMEVLEIPGYTADEKLMICKRYILERQIKGNGLSDNLIEFTDKALAQLIEEYTREAGLRNLERRVAAICRKVAKKVAIGYKELTKVTESSLSDYLGPPVFLPEEEQVDDEIGVATGLAWTPVGGEILHIEATTMPGRGALNLTGQLGDVMKESAQAALSFARSRSKELNLPSDFHKKLDIHIHIPAGGIPKDGPSAGITMASTIISVLTKTPIDKSIAMTGEITLRGRVLPVGGIKEKCLAAMRVGITTIVMPKRNEKDLEEIPKEQRKKMKFVFVTHMDEVMDVVFIKPKKSPQTKKTTTIKSSSKASKKKPVARA